LKDKTFKIAFLGLMLGTIIVLLVIERMLPPLPFLPPHFKLGLSNIIVMYTLFFVGKKEALTLAILKSFFNLLMRGPLGGLLSLCGGMLSIIIIILLSGAFKSKISIFVLSIFGAIAHNVGQIAVVSALLQNINLLIYYMPVLLVAGGIVGAITGMSSKILMPILSRLQKNSPINKENIQGGE